MGLHVQGQNSTAATSETALSAPFEYCFVSFNLQNHQLQQAMARGGSGEDFAGEGADDLPYGHGDPYRELWEVRRAGQSNSRQKCGGV